jgi:hypothetical protein
MRRKDARGILSQGEEHRGNVLMNRMKTKYHPVPNLLGSVKEKRDWEQ